MSNRCPNCNNKINNKDKFCKECGDKIEHNRSIENKEISKEKKGNKNIRLAFVLIMFQMLFNITGLITGNSPFKINSGDDISVFVGYNIFLIIAIILLLKNKKEVKSNLKRNMTFIIISIVLLIITVVINQAEIKINYDQYKEDSTNNKTINKTTTSNEGEKINIDCFYILLDDYNTAKQAIDEMNNGAYIDEIVEKYNGEIWHETCSREDILEEIWIEYSNLGIFEYSSEPIETEYGYYVIFRNSNQILSGTSEKIKKDFENFIQEKEILAKEIWISDEYDSVFEEIIITDNKVFRCTRIGDSCQIYEIKLIKNKNYVYVYYCYGDDVIDFEGEISSDLLTLYSDGGTIYSQYNKK